MKNSVTFTELDIRHTRIEMHFEACAVKMKSDKTIIVSLYTPSGSEIHIFFRQLELLNL